jgi:hypothetical protein
MRTKPSGAVARVVGPREAARDAHRIVDRDAVHFANLVLDHAEQQDAVGLLARARLLPVQVVVHDGGQDVRAVRADDRLQRLRDAREVGDEADRHR